MTFILAVLFSIFLFMLIPIYWKNYGPANFLWMSDIGLFLTVAALWLHSSLLISMAVVGILPLELIWVTDYFYRLATHKKLFGISNYMFNSKYTRFLRALSLFHLVLPVVWIGYLCEWGYNAKAPLYQTALAWVVLSLTYFCTNPRSNINWVFLPEDYHWKKISPLFWFIVLLFLFPLILIWPMHALISHIF